MLKGDRAWLDKKARRTGLARLVPFEGRIGFLVFLIAISGSTVVSAPEGLAETLSDLAWAPLRAFAAFLMARWLMRRIVRSRFTAPLQSPRPSTSADR